MPIPETMPLAGGSDKEWELLPEDTYQVQVLDIKEKHVEWQGESKPKMEFEFVIIEDGEHYGRKLWKRMTPMQPIPSTNNKDPWIWKIASAIAKKKLTRAEGEKYTPADINGLIGKQLRVSVSISAPNAQGKQYNNIEGVLVAKAELPAFDAKKVPKENAPKEASKPTPAEIVAQASGGAFVPKSLEHVAPLEMGELPNVPDEEDVNVEDVPF